MYLKYVRIFVPKIIILSDQLQYDSSNIYNTNYEKQISMYKIVRTNICADMWINLQYFIKTDI